MATAGDHPCVRCGHRPRGRQLRKC
jgi:hypothetical protein